MRVLLIDVNCKLSSTGQIVYNLYTYLNKQGYIASICYGRGKIINEKNIYKFGLDWETNCHALLTRITGYTGCFSYFSTKRLIQFVESFQPDVVHIHELHAYFINDTYFLTYLASKNIKVVHTLHCEFSYTGKCGHSLNCEKWKTECDECPMLKSYPSTLFFDHTRKMFIEKKRAFDKINDLVIVTPSNWLLERAKLSLFSKRKIITIHNGIDTNIFKPVDTIKLRRELDIKEDEKVVLALAPHLMSDLKGGKFILKIAQELKSIAKFIFIGIDGEIGHHENNVFFMGPIYDKKKLAEFYSLADIFVICSKRENYPTTCLEAQACGTPICGFDTGGTKETCITGGSAHLVKYSDVNALEKVIYDMPRKPNMDSEWLIKNAKKLLSNDTMGENYMNIYKSFFL